MDGHSGLSTSGPSATPSVSQQWLHHPERLWLRRAVFQIHLWLGTAVGVYVLLVSISGSGIVFRNELAQTVSLNWLVNLHENLLSGSAGRLVNGIGALCVVALCVTGAVIWWPGVQHWRRSLTVSWSANFARISWDLHSALGFWSFAFLLVWGVSGLYFSFPEALGAVPDQALYALSQLHFGRFGWFTEAIWAVVGLVPAILAFTGVFICCRRVMLKKPSNPKHAA